MQLTINAFPPVIQNEQSVEIVHVLQSTDKTHKDDQNVITVLGRHLQIDTDYLSVNRALYGILFTDSYRNPTALITSCGRQGTRNHNITLHSFVCEATLSNKSCSCKAWSS